MSTRETGGEARFGSGGRTLADAGEGELLAALVAIAGVPAGGDDAAVWTPAAGRDLAVSIDALVEDVDFRRPWTTPRQLGRRAFAVAVSDLAGTGATPRQCVATLCAAAAERVDDVLEVQRGLCSAAAAAGCAVVGGDVSAIDGPLVIDVCVIGELPAGRSLRRNAGRSGDVLVVTGHLGRAAAGLRLLEGAWSAADAPPGERAWVAAQLDPVARLAEGRRLLDAGVGCAGDISDGLAVDAARTAAGSGCAAELWVDSLPVDADLSARFGHDWLQLAVAGGEDFELLAAMPAELFATIAASWPAALAPLTVVGRLCEGAGVRLLDGRGGTAVTSPAPLSRHFS